jgi:hypothetical protein
MWILKNIHAYPAIPKIKIQWMETFSSSYFSLLILVIARLLEGLQMPATQELANQQLQYVDGCVHVSVPESKLAVLVLTMQHRATSARSRARTTPLRFSSFIPTLNRTSESDCCHCEQSLLVLDYTCAHKLKTPKIMRTYVFHREMLYNVLDDGPRR